MTDDTGAGQRSPELAMAPVAVKATHGHRKMTGALATVYSGEIAGQDLIKFIWDRAIEVMNWWLGTPLEPMPEKVAASIFVLFAMAAFYQTEEKQ